MNLKSLIVSINLLLFCFVAQGQTYVASIEEAEKLYDEKKYEESGKAYDKAFLIQNGDNGDYYSAACSWALANNVKKSFAALNSSIEKGWVDLDWMLNDEDLKTLHAAKEWQILVTSLKKKIALIEKNYNRPLKDELELIGMKDQALRQLLKPAEEKFGPGTPEINYFTSLVRDQDSINQKRVMVILDQYGWPATSLVGEKANNAVALVIQHAPLQVQEKYIPLLRTSVQKKESTTDMLPLMEDRILMRNGKPQIYGSQVIPNQTTKKYELYNLYDPKNVDKRRAEMGLEPLQDYLKRFGIEWSSGGVQK